MSKAVPKVTRTISWDEEFIKFIVFNIFITRILAFVIKRLKLKIRLEGKSHFRQRMFVIFGVDLLMFLFGSLAFVPQKGEEVEYSDFLKRFLKLHNRYHQLAGNDICCVCLNIGLVQPHFMKYVPESKLYPDVRQRLEQSSKLLTSFF
jgi:hypothetical protein